MAVLGIVVLTFLVILFGMFVAVLVVAGQVRKLRLEQGAGKERK